MPDPEILDFDALVRKHARIVPAYRCFQIASWAVLLVLLAYLAMLFVVVVIDFIWFAAESINARYHASSALLTLDFKFSRSAVGYLLSGEPLRRSWMSPVDLIVTWPLAVFVGLSLLSFQLDRLSLAASIALALRAALRLVHGGVADGARWHGAFDLTFVPIVTIAWDAIVYGYLWIFVFSTLRQVYTLSTPERIILREGAVATRFAPASFLHVFGIPPNIRNATRRVRTVLFAYLANVVGFGPVALFFISVPLAYVLLYATYAPIARGEYDAARSPFAAGAFTVGLFHAVTVACIVLALLFVIMAFRAAGNLGLRVSRRFMRVSLTQAQAADLRRPVLFLRSFRDDTVVLEAPRANFAYRLLTYADRKKSLDALLLEEGTVFGPVVALGNPRDAVPPYGAARGYVQHGDWQALASRLMEEAAAIVICVDDTPSLLWEIDHISRNAYLAKTLVLLHPKYADRARAADMLERVDRAFGLALAGASSDQGMIFGFWHDSAQRLRVGSASRFSRGHYLLMLRWFLRSRLETAS